MSNGDGSQRFAKENKLKLYGATLPTANGSQTPVRNPAANNNKTQFEGQVVRVWSADQIVRLDPLRAL